MTSGDGASNATDAPPWRYSLALATAVAVALKLVLASIAAVNGHVRTHPELAPGGVLGFMTQPFLQSDAIGFQLVAEHGYPQDTPGDAFFPGIPFVLSAGHVITRLSLAIVGFLTSTIFAIAALAVTHRYIARLFQRDIATLTVLFIALSPSGFYLVSPYAEAPFLLLTVCSLWALENRHLFGSVTAAAMATVTRPQGILLTAPLAWNGLKQRRWPWLVWIVLAPAAALGALQLASLMAGIHMGIIGAQRWYGRVPQWPWITAWDSIRYAASGRPDEAANLVTLCLVAILVVKGWKRLPSEWTVLTIVSVLPILSQEGGTSPLMGFSRYALVIFPIFVTAALILQRRFAVMIPLLGISTILMVLRFLTYASGQFVA